MEVLSRLKASFEACIGLFRQLKMKTLGRDGVACAKTALCNGVFCFLLGHKLSSNEARKVGLVTDFDPKGKISEVRIHDAGC